MRHPVGAALFVAAVLAVQAHAQKQGDDLKKAEGKAKEIVTEERERRINAYRELERLRKDLRYISEELDRDTLGPAKLDLEGYAQRGLDRIADLRLRGNISPRLEGALDTLEGIYRDLPKKEYAKEYPRGLVKAIAHELRWIAEEEQAKSEDELLGLLDRQLAIPEEGPGGDDTKALFPVDLPLDRFKRLGPIRIFLVKHRLKRPKTHATTTAEDIVAGKHNVQVGVELTGQVTEAGLFWGDGDYTFDFGKLHIELTPEWRLLHPGTPKPKKGDRVRIKGWTYWDVFHKAEEEFEPDHPTLGLLRPTLWEVHPVQTIEILP